MDHLSFVFSLLLIVSVTTITCGSVIKAKSPNGEEREALLKRSHDAQAKLKGQKSSRDKDSEMSKRISPGTAIDGVKLTGGLQKAPLDARGIVTRKVTIIIENKSAHTWECPSTYFKFGTADESLPHYVENGKNVTYRSHNRFLLVGTSGVLVYHIRISGEEKTLAVLWKVPFGQLLFKSCWKIDLYNEFIMANPNLFDTKNCVSAGVGVGKILGYGLKATGLMTKGGEATLKIKVF